MRQIPTPKKPLAKWATRALAALAAGGAVLAATGGDAQAQQTTFHLDRLEVPGAPDDGLVLFRPATQKLQTFYAQLGLGLSVDPLRTSNRSATARRNASGERPPRSFTARLYGRICT